jgi:hypothetical protein
MTMGDFSRDPEVALKDALAKNYSRVRFQQGKAVLDSELNLLADLASPQRFAQNNFGNGIRGDGSDFLITNLSVPTNDFTITAGTCLLNGYEVVLLANTTYRNQPRAENVAPLPAGNSNVYLRVFRSEVNGVQDAGLLNAGDVGSETSIREKVEWEVLVTTQTIDARDHLLLAVINSAGPTVTDRRRKSLNVGAIRDELSNARGSTAQLSARLDASLTPTGALRPNIVGNGQIADNAIGTTKLADGAVANTKLADSSVSTQKIANNAVTAAQLADNAVISAKIVNNGVTTTKIADANVTTPKLAPGAVTEPTLANDAVSNRTIVNGAVSLAKLNATEVVNQQVTVLAAPAGQRAEQVVPLLQTDSQAFFLVSVHFDEPRPGGPIPITRSCDWKYRVTLQKLPLLGAFRHFHQVVIEHTNNVDIKVTVQALRLA